jgi:PleD family two-component response regulator
MFTEDNRQKILIVDDAPLNIEMLGVMLADDYQISFAMDGQQAISMIGKSQPDLILLDIMMPDMDGFEVCRYIKDSEELAHIPVIFITVLGEATEESLGLSMGAADYISKPFNADLVRLRVRNHLELKKQRDLLERRTQELENALAEVKVLRGIIPICAACKNIRDDQGYWNRLENYIQEHTDAEFSHGICPSCAKELYPEQYAAMCSEGGKTGQPS